MYICLHYFIGSTQLTRLPAAGLNYRILNYGFEDDELQSHLSPLEMRMAVRLGARDPS